MSMPQGGEPGRPWDTGQDPGATGQQGGPQNNQYQGQPYQGQEQYQGQQYQGQGQQYQGQPQYGGPQGGGPGYAPPGPGYGSGVPVSPVNIADTHVTGRRIVQYIIDYFITGLIGSVIMWAFDHGSGALNTVLIIIGVIINIAWYFWYWVLRPYQHNGQTFGMQWLKLRVISKDGGRASMMQLFIRGILLIIDTLIWGLVGFITIICSRYRQRVGDHAAKTLVVQAHVQPMQVQRQFAGAGQTTR
jgi:uncharacterized RDD family membrane protein YckC